MKSKKNNTQKIDNKKNDLEGKTSFTRRSLIKALAGLPILGFFTYGVIKKLSFEQNKNLLINKKLGLTDIKTPQLLKGGIGKNKDLLRVGIIGFGSRASAHAAGLGYISQSEADMRMKNNILDDWLDQENLNVAITGICDVFDLHAEKGLAIANTELHPGGGPSKKLPVKRYLHYQDMLESSDIDAVMIATPDHHHARITIDAVKAGKHVYCEKPLTRAENEPYEVYDAVKNSNVVFQLGASGSTKCCFSAGKRNY
ncbi:Gfo/Idh/MocA family protein [Bacteroidota bacterium]